MSKLFNTPIHEFHSPSKTGSMFDIENDSDSESDNENKKNIISSSSFSLHKKKPNQIQQNHHHKTTIKHLSLSQQAAQDRRSSVIRGNLDERADAWDDVTKDVLAFHDILNEKHKKKLKLKFSNDIKISSSSPTRLNKNKPTVKPTNQIRRTTIQLKTQRLNDIDNNNNSHDNKDYRRASNVLKTPTTNKKKNSPNKDKTEDGITSEGGGGGEGGGVNYSCDHVGERWHSHFEFTSAQWPDRLVSALFAEKLLKELNFLSGPQEAHALVELQQAFRKYRADNPVVTSDFTKNSRLKFKAGVDVAKAGLIPTHKKKGGSGGVSSSGTSFDRSNHRGEKPRLLSPSIQLAPTDDDEMHDLLNDDDSNDENGENDDDDNNDGTSKNSKRRKSIKKKKWYLELIKPPKSKQNEIVPEDTILIKTTNNNNNNQFSNHSQSSMTDKNFKQNSEMGISQNDLVDGSGEFQVLDNFISHDYTKDRFDGIKKQPIKPSEIVKIIPEEEDDDICEMKNTFGFGFNGFNGGGGGASVSQMGSYVSNVSVTNPRSQHLQAAMLGRRRSSIKKGGFHKNNKSIKNNMNNKNSHIHNNMASSDSSAKMRRSSQIMGSKKKKNKAGNVAGSFDSSVTGLTGNLTLITSGSTAGGGSGSKSGGAGAGKSGGGLMFGGTSLKTLVDGLIAEKKKKQALLDNEETNGGTGTGTDKTNNLLKVTTPMNQDKKTSKPSTANLFWKKKINKVQPSPSPKSPQQQQQHVNNINNSKDEIHININNKFQPHHHNNVNDDDDGAKKMSERKMVVVGSAASSVGVPWLIDEETKRIERENKKRNAEAEIFINSSGLTFDAFYEWWLEQLRLSESSSRQMRALYKAAHVLWTRECKIIGVIPKGILLPSTSPRGQSTTATTATAAAAATTNGNNNLLNTGRSVLSNDGDGEDTSPLPQNQATFKKMARRASFVAPNKFGNSSRRNSMVL